MIQAAALTALLLAADPAPIEPETWISQDDYPQEARSQAWEGMVRFRLDVTSRGEVVSCTILQSTGHSTLDVAACTLMRANGRFRPALDRYGRPAAGKIVRAVRWTLPRDDEEMHAITVSVEAGVAVCRFADDPARRLRPDPCRTLAGELASEGKALPTRTVASAPWWLVEQQAAARR